MTIPTNIKRIEEQIWFLEESVQIESGIWPKGYYFCLKMNTFHLGNTEIPLYEAWPPELQLNGPFDTIEETKEEIYRWICQERNTP